MGLQVGTVLCIAFVERSANTERISPLRNEAGATGISQLAGEIKFSMIADVKQ
jgi:hypothetical protein